MYTRRSPLCVSNPSPRHNAARHRVDSSQLADEVAVSYVDLVAWLVRRVQGFVGVGAGTNSAVWLAMLVLWPRIPLSSAAASPSRGARPMLQLQPCRIRAALQVRQTEAPC